MRVALVALHFAEYAWNLAEALAENNDVLVIFSARNMRAEMGALRAISHRKTLEIFYIYETQSIVQVILDSIRLVRRIRQFRPDVLHYQEDGKDAFIAALPWLRKIPLVLTVHDPRPHSGRDSRLHKWHRLGLYVRILRRRADVVIVHGKKLISEAENANPFLKGRVFAVAHGPLGLDDVDTTESSVHWTPGRVLFFGRIEEYKGLRFFVDAVKQLALNGVGVVGVVAGTGPDLEPYRDAIDSDPHFELHEGFIPRDQVGTYFRDANVVVLPYSDGTQSGVAAMALGYGRPVVASDVGSISELVEDGETGILVPAGSVNDLVAAIRRLVDDQEAASMMAARARELSSGRVSWRRISELTTCVYADAISQHRTSS